MSVPSPTPRGRGAQSNASGRFESLVREAFDDGWTAEDEAPAQLKTEVTAERSKTIIARNNSPDVGFDRSINPYRGCEHGCIYWVVTHRSASLTQRLPPLLGDPVQGLLNEGRARAIGMIGAKAATIGRERVLIASLTAEVLSFVEVALQQMEANRQRSALRSQLPV